MRILGIGAHPDDIEFGCGGTFYKFAREGHRIHLLVMTPGELGGGPEARRLEQESSAKLMRAKLYWGGFKDTGIGMSRELIQMIEKHMAKIKPEFIFTHYWDDTHQDHRNVAQATVTAARYVRNMIFYEVPTTFNFSPTIFADIKTVFPRKLDILRCHKSQVHKTKVAGLSILESVKSTAIFRGYQDRTKYAEAFVPQRLSLDLKIG